MKNFRKIFSLGIAVLALTFVFLGTSKVEAAARTASVSGNWEDTATWGGDAVPTASDTVTINTNINVDINSAAVASSVTINSAGSNSGGIEIKGINSLTVSGAVTLAAPSGDDASSELSVGAGTLTAGSLVITGGAAASRIVQVSVSTGTIDVAGDVTFSGTASAARLTSTGASNIYVGGNFTSGGTLDGTGSTITFDGTGSVLFGVYATYNDVVIDKTDPVADGVTLASGTTTILGDLTVTSGFFNTYQGTFTASGSTLIEEDGTLRISDTTGSKTFTGDVTVNGTWNESVAEAVAFAGSLENNGTFTANTGTHTFSGASKTIGGDNEVTIPSLTISGLTSNTGVLTVSTTLAGASTLTNAAGATLNFGGASITPTLTATATSNTVNYNNTGAQTVKVTDYYNLTLSGSGTKAIGNGTTVAGTLDINLGSKASLTGSSTTKYLRFNGTLKKAGAWGFTGAAGASFINTDYLATNSGVEGEITASRGSSGIPATIITIAETDQDTTESATTPNATLEETTTVKIICPKGNLFDTVTGKACTEFTQVSTPSVVAKTYAFGTTLVKMGTKGEACRAWQSFLNDKANAGLVTDGWCGKLTIAKAKLWQASVGLVADGFLGPMSRNKANSL